VTFSLEFFKAYAIAVACFLYKSFSVNNQIKLIFWQQNLCVFTLNFFHQTQVYRVIDFYFVLLGYCPICEHKYAVSKFTGKIQSVEKLLAGLKAWNLCTKFGNYFFCHYFFQTLIE